MKKNLILAMLTIGMASNITHTEVFAAQKKGLGEYHTQIVAKYFKNSQDAIKLEAVNKKEADVMKMFRFNPTSIRPEHLALYPNIETLHLYTDNDVKAFLGYNPADYIANLPDGLLKDAGGKFYKIEVHSPISYNNAKKYLETLNKKLKDWSLDENAAYHEKQELQKRLIGSVKFLNVTANDCGAIGNVDEKTREFLFNDDIYTGYKTPNKSDKDTNKTYFIKEIGDSCFSDHGLKSIKIPDSVEVIGKSSFSECILLTDITIPDSVKVIDDSAFSGCAGLAEVAIPESVTSIGSDAFSYCRDLRNVKLPPRLTYIGRCAFRECDMLNTITVPASVTSIDDDFVCGSNQCTVVVPYKAMESVLLYDEDGPGLRLVKNIIVNIDEKAGDCDYKIWWPDDGRLVIPGCKQEGFEKLPINLGYHGNAIHDNMFERRTDLIDVIIGEGVKSIGKSSFASCKQLKHVAIPKTVSSIGEFAFISCKDLSHVEISGEVQHIGKGAFCGTDIETFVVPNSVTSIEEGVFLRCNKLASITIHDNVKSIGKRAFMECVGLIDVDLKNVTLIKGNAFKGCAGLKSITISNNITKIGSGAFTGCTALKNIFVKCSEGKISNKKAAEIKKMIDKAKGNYDKVRFIDANGEKIQPTDE